MTLNRYDKLENLLKSVETWTLMPDAIYVMDNGGKLEQANFLDDFGDYEENPEFHKFLIPKEKGEVIILNPGYNMGVGSSWNWFIRLVPSEVVVISNDDVVLDPEAFENLYKAVEEHPENPIVNETEGSWSLFAQRKSSLKDIGEYDENFWPAYFEDNDYHYRMRQKGFERHIADGVTFSHETSSTLQAFTEEQMQQHHARFRLNQIYYLEKWGGEPLAEKYTKPFDGKREKPRV
jgi:GT2 family glycosyltransferase